MSGTGPRGRWQQWRARVREVRAQVQDWREARPGWRVAASTYPLPGIIPRRSLVEASELDRASWPGARYHRLRPLAEEPLPPGAAVVVWWHQEFETYLFGVALDGRPPHVVNRHRGYFDSMEELAAHAAPYDIPAIVRHRLWADQAMRPPFLPPEWRRRIEHVRAVVRAAVGDAMVTHHEYGFAAAAGPDRHPVRVVVDAERIGAAAAAVVATGYVVVDRYVPDTLVIAREGRHIALDTDPPRPGDPQ